MATRRDRGRSISDGIQGSRQGTSEVSTEYPQAAGDPLSTKAGILALPEIAPELPSGEPRVSRQDPSPAQTLDNFESVIDYCRMELRKIWDVLRGFESKGKLSPLSRLGSFLDQEGRIVAYYDSGQDKVVQNTNLAKLDGNNTFAGANTFNGAVDVNSTFTANTLSLGNGLDVAGNVAITGTLDVIGTTDVERLEYLRGIPTGQTLTSAATVSVNWNQGDYKVLVLGHNVVIENPTNEASGQVMQILIKGHASTTYTVSWDTQYMFPGGTAPTHPGPGATDIYTILCQNGSIFHVTYAQDFS